MLVFPFVCIVEYIRAVDELALIIKHFIVQDPVLVMEPINPALLPPNKTDKELVAVASLKVPAASKEMLLPSVAS